MATDDSCYYPISDVCLSLDPSFSSMLIDSKSTFTNPFLHFCAPFLRPADFFQPGRT